MFQNVGEEGQRSVHRSTQSWLNLALTATNRMHQASYLNVGPELYYSIVVLYIVYEEKILGKVRSMKLHLFYT